MITRLSLRGIREALDVEHIEKALEAVPRVQSVSVDRGRETATIEHDGAHLQELHAAARSVGVLAEEIEPAGAAATAQPGGTKIILAPIDFSDVTERVLQEAATLARMLSGRVVLVHVTEPTTGVVDYAAIVVAVAQVNEAAVKYAQERVRQLEERLRNEGVQASAVHVTGTPVAEIIEQARTLRADYIVIGSHGHTAFYDLLVGGTAHGVLKRATCPVVIVPPAKNDARE